MALLLLGGVHARRHGGQGAGDEDIIFVAQVLGRLDDREGLVQVNGLGAKAWATHRCCARQARLTGG